MNKIEQVIASAILDNEIVALRFAATQERAVDAKLKALRESAKWILAQAKLENKTGQQEAIRSFKAASKEAYEELTQAQFDDLREFMALTSEATVSVINGAVSIDLFKRVNRLSANVAAMIIDGTPAAEWWSRQAESTQRAFAREIRNGFVSGETTDEIARRIIGRRGQPGILDVSLRQARSLAHTSVMTAANLSVDEVLQENDDLVNGFYWVSTLDSRTCFPAGTLVETPDGGHKRIENLRAGDTVLGGSRVPRKVRGTFSKKARRLVRITLSNGEKMECTPDHLILKSDGTWCEAGKLSVSDLIAKKLK